MRLSEPHNIHVQYPPKISTLLSAEDMAQTGEGAYFRIICAMSLEYNLPRHLQQIALHTSHCCHHILFNNNYCEACGTTIMCRWSITHGIEGTWDIIIRQLGLIAYTFSFLAY